MARTKAQLFTASHRIPPQPRIASLAEIAHFIENAPGKDNAQKIKDMRLSFLLPMPLHKLFKSLCAAHGLKMADEIRALIERRTEQLSKQLSK